MFYEKNSYFYFAYNFNFIFSYFNFILNFINPPNSYENQFIIYDLKYKRLVACDLKREFKKMEESYVRRYGVDL